MPVNDQARVGGEGLASRLARQVQERTRGRVRGVRVEVTADRVVVHGRTDSYHVKQLALQAVGEVTNSATVVLDIQVGGHPAGAGGG